MGHISVRRSWFESSIIPSVKSPAKNPRHQTTFFFKILYIPSEIRSVTTDRISDGLQAISNYYRQQNYVGIDQQLQTECTLSIIITDKIIPSVILLVLVEFLVVNDVNII